MVHGHGCHGHGLQRAAYAVCHGGGSGGKQAVCEHTHASMHPPPYKHACTSAATDDDHTTIMDAHASIHV